MYSLQLCKNTSPSSDLFLPVSSTVHVVGIHFLLKDWTEEWNFSVFSILENVSFSTKFEETIPRIHEPFLCL